MDRFFDVTVKVWAELGRVQLTLGELLRLGEGAVLKLDRPISAPVDLMAQGVCFARGEVVVMDDYFAIRIKEIETSKRIKSVM
jgi:flagellar motor switch protein FliN/FliY